MLNRPHLPEVAEAGSPALSNGAAAVSGRQGMSDPQDTVNHAGHYMSLLCRQYSHAAVQLEPLARLSHAPACCWWSAPCRGRQRRRRRGRCCRRRRSGARRGVSRISCVRPSFQRLCTDKARHVFDCCAVLPEVVTAQCFRARISPHSWPSIAGQVALDLKKECLSRRGNLDCHAPDMPSLQKNKCKRGT